MARGVPGVRREAAADAAVGGGAAAPPGRRAAAGDRITDLYNAVSVAHLLPVGGEDLDRYAGPARLVRAHGNEIFETTSGGQPLHEHPEPGEVVWRDHTGVTCRRWNWRQCTRTRITGATTSAVFVLDALSTLGADGLHAAGRELADTLTRQHPHAQFASRLIGSTS